MEKSCVELEKFVHLGIKIKVMSTSTFFILLPIVIVVLFLIRVFWMDFLAILLTLKIAFYIVALSFVSALIWTALFGGDQEGFWRCCLFFGITYTVGVIFAFGVVGEIFSIGVDIIRSIFRIK